MSCPTAQEAWGLASLIEPLSGWGPYLYIDMLDPGWNSDVNIWISVRIQDNGNMPASE